MIHPLTDGDDLAWWLIEKAIEPPENTGGHQDIHHETTIHQGGTTNIIVGDLPNNSLEPASWEVPTIIMGILVVIWCFFWFLTRKTAD